MSKPTAASENIVRDLTLDEWLYWMRRELAAFEDHWREQQAKHPELYPDVLGAGDWFEQFSLSEGYELEVEHETLD